MSIVVGILAFRVSQIVASAFGELPPAYHDEFSYLFQTQTFLAGRVSFPSFAPLPELFDQMHVLNEGRFASRYFPGAGLWLAPFVALGNPWLGQWLAQALTAYLVFWIGRELGGNRTGLFAGLLTAFCPGLALFSNLLLAHHPTLVGLTLFILAWLRMWRTGSAVWALVGVAVYALYRPHGSLAAGAVAIAAGLYELTPLKQRFRRRCRESVHSGFELGLCCVGSSIGLMLMLVALGVMSVTWMSVIVVPVLAQKLLPAKAAIDAPLALAIVGLGILIVLAPSSVPGLGPPM